jgi:hypothetical protein
MTRVIDPDGNVANDYAPVDVWIYGPAYQQDEEDLWHAQYPSMANTYDGTLPSTIELLMPYTIPSVFSNSEPDNHFNAEGQWDPWAATTGGWNVFDFPTWTLDGLGINVSSDSLDVPDDMLYVYVGYNMASTAGVDNIATIWQDGTPDPNDNWSCRSTLHIAQPLGSNDDKDIPHSRYRTTIQLSPVHEVWNDRTNYHWGLVFHLAKSLQGYQLQE